MMEHVGTGARKGVTEMGDYLVRGTAAGGAVRVMATVTTQTVEDARVRHATSPTATAALGRSLTAAVLLRVLGDGPVGGIVAQADAQGHVRGYAVNPQADLPHTDGGKLDVGGLVGRSGMLHVTRDVGLRTPYHGSAPLVSGEIAEDLASYLATSEQLPSVVALGVLVGRDLRVLASGGLCLQVLPGASQEVVEALEARALGLRPITQLVAEGSTPEDIVAEVAGDLSPVLTGRYPVSFHCRCSRRRVEEMLAVLGAEELEALLAQEGRAEVVCRFCGDRYLLEAAEVRALIASLRSGALVT